MYGCICSVIFLNNSKGVQKGRVYSFSLSSCMHSYCRAKDRGGRRHVHLFPGNGQSDLGFIASLSQCCELNIYEPPGVHASLERCRLPVSEAGRRSPGI